MKRYGALALVLAAGALIVLLSPVVFGPNDAGPIERPDGRAPGVTLGGTAAPAGVPKSPPVADPSLVGSPDTRSPESPTGAVGAPVAAPAGDAEESPAAAVWTGDLPAGWEAAPPAQRPHAIRPPRARGPRLGGGGRGGVGPTGHWTRFPPPPPPRGDADLRVFVTDASGAPVPGADLLLGPPSSLHAEAVSFGDLRRIGTANAAGRFDARDLPAGAAALAGNLGNALNGPRGLDMRSSIPVLLVSGARVDAHLQLPFEVGGFGRVTGRVVDGEGRGVGRAAVICGYVRVYAEPDGRFEAPRIPAGPRVVGVSRTGYAPARAEVDVPAGGATDVTVVLSYRETGSLHVHGRVTATEGGGIEGAMVYLIDEGGRGTLRSVRTDDAGDYAFEALPDRLRTDACRIQAGKHTEGYRATTVRFEHGIEDPRVDVVLPPRQVLARFVLSDASDGSPVTRCRIEPERLDAEGQDVRGFLGSRADGMFEHWFDPGRYRFVVEAPDHETQTVEADLRGEGTTVEIAVAMAPHWAGKERVTLRVRVEDASTGGTVERGRIELADPDAGVAVARFEGDASDGVFSLPVPSGRWLLRVAAAGYERFERTIELAADPPAADLTVHLRPE